MMQKPPPGSDDGFKSADPGGSLGRLAALLALLALLVPGSGPSEAQETEERTDRNRDATPASTGTLCTPATVDGAVVEGTVRDRDAGAQLAGSEVRIAVIPAPNEGSLIERSTTVDGRGRYRFCDLPGGRSGRLTAIFGGFMGTMQRVELTAGDTSTVELRVPLGRAAYMLGWVRDAERGQPVEDAMVRLEPLGLTAFTNDRGRFRLPRVPPGSYVLTVEHVAFGPRATAVEVEPEAGLEVNVRLPVRTVAMEPLEVTVESRPRYLMRAGFFERAELGFGRYLTPEEVERRQAARVRHLLMGLPGVRIPPCSRGFECNNLPRSYSDCPMTLWVDGVRIRAGGLEWVSAHDVAAVEVYRGPAEMPAEFADAFNSCGAVVLWTKR